MDVNVGCTAQTIDVNKIYGFNISVMHCIFTYCLKDNKIIKMCYEVLLHALENVACLCHFRLVPSVFNVH